MLPPIFMQVDDASIRTKPAPYSAHVFTVALAGRSGIEAAGLSGFRSRDCCAGADDADSTSTVMSKMVRIRRFYRGRRGFATARI
jgi:hypothetical protein